MKKLLLFLLVAGVYVLHQDFWNWGNTGLFFNNSPHWLATLLRHVLFIDPSNGFVFGFLPVGLAYHAGYSILAAIMMAVLVKFAWPKHLEDVEPDKSPKNKPPEDGR